MHMTHAYSMNPSDFGMLWAYRFRKNGTSEALPTDTATGEINKGEGWIWIHLGLADTRCRGWIAGHAPISEGARETLLDPDEHIRLDIYGEEVVAILPDFHQEFLQEGDDLVRLHIALS